MAAEGAGTRGFGYDPVFVPGRRAAHDGRADRRREGRDLPPGACGARAAGMARRVTGEARTASTGRERTRAAAVSIVSNTLLIALKLFAGAVTGSVAILTEAIHSGDRPDRLLHRLLLRAPGRGARRRRAPLRPREVRERRRGGRGRADPRRLRRDHLRLGARADPGPRARVARLRHRGRRLRLAREPASSRRGCSAARPRRSRPRSRATRRTCAPTPTRRSACSSGSRSCTGRARSGSTRWSRC